MFVLPKYYYLYQELCLIVSLQACKKLHSAPLRDLNILFSEIKHISQHPAQSVKSLCVFIKAVAIKWLNEMTDAITALLLVPTMSHVTSV